jgi:hypothetical protein
VERRGFSPPSPLATNAPLDCTPRETLGGLKARRSTNLPWPA